MANITPPKYVRHILVTLQSRGHPAYLVGGCVRDMLLGESITGLFRFVESLLIAASIAGGFLLATVLAEGVL